METTAAQVQQYSVKPKIKQQKLNKLDSNINTPLQHSSHTLPGPPPAVQANNLTRAFAMNTQARILMQDDLKGKGD